MKHLLLWALLAAALFAGCSRNNPFEPLDPDVLQLTVQDSLGYVFVSYNAPNGRDTVIVVADTQWKSPEFHASSGRFRAGAFYNGWTAPLGIKLIKNGSVLVQRSGKGLVEIDTLLILN